MYLNFSIICMLIDKLFSVVLLIWTIFSLHTQHQEQIKNCLIRSITSLAHCLDYLVPTERDQSVIDWLLSANKLPFIFARTSRFKNSFICYCLNSSVNDLVFVWLCNLVFELPYINWLIDLLVLVLFCNEFMTHWVCNSWHLT